MAPLVVTAGHVISPVVVSVPAMVPPPVPTVTEPHVTPLQLRLPVKLRAPSVHATLDAQVASNLDSPVGGNVDCFHGGTGALRLPRYCEKVLVGVRCSVQVWSGVNGDASFELPLTIVRLLDAPDLRFLNSFKN